MLKALARKKAPQDLVGRRSRSGPHIAAREAHGCELEVWTARPADFGASLTHDLEGLLDESERARAARFRHEADRRSYVLAHALRRAVLARWLAADPLEICFSEEPGGRPVLRGPIARGVYFSHSRSRDAVACAVTSVAPVGIDVETVHAGGADEEMISRFVVPAGDDGLAPDDRDSRFYFYWTALEAFWKAEGKGLADANPRIDLRQDACGRFEVWLEGEASGRRARLLPIRHSPAAWVTLAVCTAAEIRLQLFNANNQLVNELAAHHMLSRRYHSERNLRGVNEQ